MTLAFPPAGPLPLAAGQGFAPNRLADAVAVAAARETFFPRDLRAHLEAGYFEPPPDNAILGPVAARGAPNGLVLRHGQVAAAWGDTRQVDMTFSVAKSYLSLLAGIAVGDGLFVLDDRVSASVPDPAFASPHNAAITWRMLLTQTSEWEGSLFGKSETIDRGRDLSREGKGKGRGRPLTAPGTTWEYNDVRVNALSLALLHSFAQPLPQVFADRIMAPIGGSADWVWDGYETSWVTIAGQRLHSVPGGGHWGGGVRMHAEDQARIGLLMLADGAWDGRRVLPEGWVAASATPVALNPDYGLLWWLNAGGKLAGAPRDGFYAAGAGGNIIWVDRDHGIVMVARWLHPEALAEVLTRITAAAA